MFIEIGIVSFVASIVAFSGAYLITYPQKAENKALHRSLDNNTAAIEKLTDVIRNIEQQQARSDERLRTVEREIKGIKTNIHELHR